ncbi:hypothetical protein [Bacillus sp. EB600]|uniref:hypothetical protein n=1 Tax=Bacillus sp. EB600 TaxID=2806345 RepID=UPI00210AED90|nr:hypothetical protein [Bacillus sp. EB600]MCQ6278565.1 hypothetical protein [Bacillus sp. EB600]
MTDKELRLVDHLEELRKRKRMKDSFLVPSDDFVLHEADEGQYPGSIRRFCPS